VNAFVCGARTAAELLFSTYTAPIRALSLSLARSYFALCAQKNQFNGLAGIQRTRKATPESEFSPRPGKSHTIASEPLSLSPGRRKKIVAARRSITFLVNACAEIIPILKRAAANGPLLRTGSLKDWRVILIPF